MSAWAGWGRDRDAHPFAGLGLHELPGPPRTRHIGAFSCCAGCTHELRPGRRCTRDLEALTRASDLDLYHGRVAGCLLDRDDELERRHRRRKYASDTPTRRRGLLERLHLRRSPTT